MAAGLGFKTFTTGEVLTAADTNGYLMQGVLVFASAAARDAAITSPQEGQFAYLKDTNVTTYYTGSAWTNLDTTGMTNPMTTTGDMVYSSSGSTPARLGIGSTGQVMTVAGGIPSWATASSGAMTLISRQSFSNVAGTGTTFDGVFTSTYKTYLAVIETIVGTTYADDLQLQFRYAGPNTQATSYYGNSITTDYSVTTVVNTQTSNATQATLNLFIGTDVQSPTSGYIYFQNVGNASEKPYYQGSVLNADSFNVNVLGGANNTARTYTGFLLKSSSTNVTGTVAVYGLAKA